MAQSFAFWILPLWFSALRTYLLLTYFTDMVIFPRPWLSLKTGQGRDDCLGTRKLCSGAKNTPKNRLQKTDYILYLHWDSLGNYETVSFLICRKILPFMASVVFRLSYFTTKEIKTNPLILRLPPMSVLWTSGYVFLKPSPNLLMSGYLFQNPEQISL